MRNVIKLTRVRLSHKVLHSKCCTQSVMVAKTTCLRARDSNLIARILIQIVFYAVKRTCARNTTPHAVRRVNRGHDILPPHSLGCAQNGVRYGTASPTRKIDEAASMALLGSRLMAESLSLTRSASCAGSTAHSRVYTAAAAAAAMLSKNLGIRP